MGNKILLPLIPLNLFTFGYFGFFRSYPMTLIAIKILSLLVLIATYFFKKIHLNRTDIVIAFALSLIGFGLYAYKIDVVTPGMWNDELLNAEQGEYLLQQNKFVPFTPFNYGHPTPLLYLTGFAIQIFGRTFLAIRLVSIIFAALNCGLIYLFFRLFASKWLAILAATIFAVLYPNLIVSRFAYEMSAAITFQILSAFFLYRFWQSSQTKHLIGLGLAVGGGLFTYLGFRSFAVVFLVIALAIVRKKSKLTHIIFILIPLFISTQTLLSYSFHHPHELNARAKSVSIFHQNLSQKELSKELQGNVQRTLGMFVSIGDPNPRQNPANSIPFDYLTVSLAALGLIVLFKQSKWQYFVTLLLGSVSLANDIFTLERIPDFHYYGLGHPNTLRIFGLFPIIAFLVLKGLQYIHHVVSKKDPKAALFVIASVAAIIVNTNFLKYFNQTVSKYNYYVNGVHTFKLIDILKETIDKPLVVSNSYYYDNRLHYFLDKTSSISAYESTKSTLEDSEMPSNTVVVLDPKDNLGLAQDVVNRFKQLSTSLDIKYVVSPWKTIDAIIIKRK